MRDGNRGMMWLECDIEGCNEKTTEHGRLHFNEMVDEAKNDGWKFEKVGGEWLHTCGKCVKLKR